MYTYLTMTSGSRAGTNYLLDPTDENRIGRGLECAIVLTDPLCSRVHAVIAHERQGLENPRRRQSQRHASSTARRSTTPCWPQGTGSGWARPNSPSISRKIPPRSTTPASRVTQTLIKNQAIDQRDAVAFRGLAAIPDSQQAQELLLLYQLSIKLLGCDEPDEVVRDRARNCWPIGPTPRWPASCGSATTDSSSPRCCFPARRRRSGRPEQVADRAGLPARKRRVDRQPEG